MASRKMCVLVALMLLASSMALLCTRAEDTGTKGVQLLSGQPSDLDTFDIAWNSNFSYAVAVGENILGADNIAYSYSAKSGAWTPHVDWGSTGILYGVDYDPYSGYFYAAGEDGISGIIVYIDAYGTYWNTISAPAGVSVLKDILFIDSNRFLVISDTRAFIYGFSGSWGYTEVAGALPLSVGNLRSVFADDSAGVFWIVGSDGLGGAESLVLFMGDINNGIYAAYDYTPQGYAPMNSGDHSPSADYSLVVGDGQVTKLAERQYSWNFTQLHPRGGPPGVRTSPAMVYCQNDFKLVTFGGYEGAGIYPDETWEYNLFTNRWTSYSPTPRPPGRRYHSMAYNPVLNEIILFGGFGASGALQDTWKYFPANHTWWQVASTTPFGARYGHQLVFNDWTLRIVTYGGYNGSPTNTMAEWNGAAWAVLSPGGTPPPVYNHAMAYDKASQHIVLFGGVGNPGQDSATYAYDPSTNTWAQLFPAVSAPKRSFGSMSWNYGIQGVCMYGGFDTACLDQIWYYRYLDNTWYLWQNTGVALSQSSIAVDYYNGIYIFGGVNDGGQYTRDLFKYGRILDMSGTGLIFNRTGYIWRDVDWYTGGTGSPDAIIVGNNGNLSHHSVGMEGISFIENTITANQFFAVACRPPQSPGYAIAMGNAGSGVRINQVFTSSTVSVDSELPHIAYMYINDSANQPMNNAKINVDVGTYTTWYKVEAELYYLQGQANFTTIDLWGWRDNGSLYGDVPAILGSGFDNAGYENVRFHYTYTVLGNVWSQVYPNHAGEMESQMWFGNCFYNVLNSTSTRITFCFYPLKQFRTASGPTIWSEPAGTRYASGVLNGQENVSALNDPFTWNLKMTANTNDGTNNSAYDEFGVYKYTYIGAADVPATISGSGPPGGTVYLAPEQNVTFISNCNYTFKVYMDGLLRGVNDANRTMPASALGVMGGDLQNWSVPGTQAHFNGTGSANALYLFGANATYRLPEFTGPSTSTGIGSVGTVRWRCIIPMATPEDRYTTTVTFLLEHD
ncbi:MAG: hypothetical protein HZB92_08050 [Euryarchaeota archaeon]|nr:hypothetical protein [Euryarchaeota archaeon]